MKTNIFKVKEKNDKKIVIEEEHTKNPLLLFLKQYKNFILLSIILFLICTLLINLGLAISLFQTSSDFDISYLNDTSDKITTNTDPSIKDEDIKETLLGEIARSEGVVILVKTITTAKNDIIYYFSDKTAIVITNTGKIYRISPISDGEYGVDDSGKINDKAKKVQVTSKINNLQDGTIITYYSDGTAKIELNRISIFVRDSNNIKLNGGTSLKNVVPSGVALSSKINRVDEITMTTYTDNTKLIIENKTMKIVNPKVNSIGQENNITYDKNNSFDKLSEKKLDNGDTVTYFQNGSAIITDKNDQTIYVKKSGDIVIKNNKIYEIITNSYGYSKSTINCSDGKKVTYFDNGAAIITYPDGTNKYVADSDEIIYNKNKNIISDPTTSKEISKKKTTDGYNVVNFDNGKSQVIKEDGTSFIIDTNKLIFDTSGNITDPNNKSDEKQEDDKKENEKEEENNNNDTPKEDPLEGMYVSEAEHTYNKTKSIEYSNFIIKNDNTKTKKFRIVIEEVSNYSKYNAERLEPDFVKFQATVGSDVVGPKILNDKLWTDENGKETYVIFDGSIKAKSTLEVALSLYVDYAELNNNYQDKTFIGTIKVYVNE